MNIDSKIYVAGHRGLVGSALMRILEKNGYKNIITKTHSELDLCHQSSVDSFFHKEQPEYVFLSAAKVGGIHANNTLRADFLRDNLYIQTNVISSAAKYHVKKLLFMGSSCVYPQLCEQPMKESELLNGKLEPTNEAYSIAKIAGIMMCQSYNQQYSTNFISVMPSNVYGLGDNYDPKHSHVLPALIRKFHEAKINNKQEVTLWGTGVARREFLYSDDLAEASLFLMKTYNDSSIINIGAGYDVSIKELATLIKNMIGFEGDIVYDTKYPDGMPRKLVDSSKLLALGFKHKIDLEEGIKLAYQDFLQNYT